MGREPDQDRDRSDARLRITSTCVVGRSELDFRFTRSGGPGGQHANTSDTRVEVRFDIAGSPSLTATQRELLVARFGPELRVAADDERSQARNRALAVERLRTKLAEGLQVQRTRRSTSPSPAARRRRLDAKRQRSDRKRQRRWQPGDE